MLNFHSLVILIYFQELTSSEGPEPKKNLRTSKIVETCLSLGQFCPMTLMSRCLNLSRTRLARFEPQTVSTGARPSSKSSLRRSVLARWRWRRWGQFITEYRPELPRSLPILENTTRPGHRSTLSLTSNTRYMYQHHHVRL